MGGCDDDPAVEATRAEVVRWSERKATSGSACVVEPAPPGTQGRSAASNGAAFQPMQGCGHVGPATIPPTNCRASTADRPRDAAGRSHVLSEAVHVTMSGSHATAWEANVGGAVQSRLLCADGIVYVPSWATTSSRWTRRPASEKWRVKTGGPVFSAPHIDDGTVYFGSGDHLVYAVDARSGNDQVEDEDRRRRARRGGDGAGRRLRRHDRHEDLRPRPIDRRVRWTVKRKNMFQSKTATDGERFFVGGWDNHFRCIDAKSGDLVWDLKLGKSARADSFSAFAPAITSPAVGDGKVFVSTNDGILHAIDIANGKEVWQVDWKKMGYSSPLYHDGRVYSRSATRASRSASTPTPASSTGRRRPARSSTIPASRSAAGTSSSATSTARSTRSAPTTERSCGSTAWAGHLLGSPAADERHVYMGSMSGKVMAVPHGAGGK